MKICQPSFLLEWAKNATNAHAPLRWQSARGVLASSIRRPLKYGRNPSRPNVKSTTCTAFFHGQDGYFSGLLEEDLIGYQDGDPQCTSHLIGCVTPLLISLFTRPSLRRVQVEELVQEVWLRIHLARHSYRPGEPPLPWLLSIARRTRIDAYWKHVRGAGRECSIEQLAAGTCPCQSSNTQPELEMKELLAALPEGQREVLQMLKVFGMSVNEVARATGAGPSAVKQRAHRAYRTLRNILGHGGNGGSGAP